jgi:hypothetical protein
MFAAWCVAARTTGETRRLAAGNIAAAAHNVGPSRASPAALSANSMSSSPIRLQAVGSCHKAQGRKERNCACVGYLSEDTLIRQPIGLDTCSRPTGVRGMDGAVQTHTSTECGCDAVFTVYFPHQLAHLQSNCAPTDKMSLMLTGLRVDRSMKPTLNERTLAVCTHTLLSQSQTCCVGTCLLASRTGRAVHK